MAAKLKRRGPGSRSGVVLRSRRSRATRNPGLKVSGTADRQGLHAVPGAAQAQAVYRVDRGVSDFVDRIRRATPLELVELERIGVDGRLVKDMAREMDIPSSRFFSMIGIPKATAEKKAATNDVITGAGGQAAIGMMRLLAIAEDIVENSTAEVKEFDVRKWLGQWLDRPQPALGGKRPAEFLDTPTGLAVVARLLGAVESGAYV